MSDELGLAAKMILLHESLATADMAHAFGGALALAWCIEEPRTTMDIDLNIFIEAARFEDGLEALPAGVTWGDNELTTLRRDGQARLAWGRHPVDVFFNTTAFHDKAAARIRWEPFEGQQVPFLDCDDLAVFKAFFNRPKDWLDLQYMLEVRSLDVGRVLGTLVEYLGPEDHRVARLRALAT